MFRLRATPSLIGHRPAWRQTFLQRSTCPQCVPLQHDQEPPRQLRRAQLQQKRFAGGQIASSLLRCGSQIALQLRETGVWSSGRYAGQTSKTPTKEKGKRVPKAQRMIAKGDKTRVNIVSRPLVNDVMEYLGPEFVKRHKGCDIIDIYPGAGLWSNKLHETLEPRSHILMEPDELYEPFLKELLEKPGVVSLPESGIVWRNLANTLTKEHLPHQVEIVSDASHTPPAPTDATQGTSTDTGTDTKKQRMMNLQDLQKEETSKQPTADSEIPRNDTLLVTANIAFHPRRRFGQFESLSQLVLFQFISSIRASSLFQKYGLVRMLIWIEEKDRHLLTARSCQRRRRLAMEGEMSTEWIDEIVSRDADKNRWFMRDNTLDSESCRRALAKMNAEGVKIPRGRETSTALEAQREAAKIAKIAEETESPVGGFGLDTKLTSTTPKIPRPYLEELAKLEHKFRHVPQTMEEMHQAKKVRDAMDFYFDSDAPAANRGGWARKKKFAEADKALLNMEESGLESTVEPAEDQIEDEDEYKLDAEDETDVLGEVDKQGVEYRRLKQLQFRRNREERTWARIDALIQELDAMSAEHGRATTQLEKAALQKREDKWNQQVAELTSQDRAEFLLYRDNRHIFKQAAPSVVLTEVRDGEIAAKEPLASMQAAKSMRGAEMRLPTTSWDARNREPLVVHEEEFFPNASCVLLDIQPKSMHPLLRSMGPGTNRAGDHFELILQVMVAASAEPVSKSIEAVWPGASTGVLKNCPSLYNVEDGGCPIGGPYGELTTRTLNEKQWVEIIEAWMKWPFRPTLSQLVQRIAEEDRQSIEDEPNRL